MQAVPSLLSYLQVWALYLIWSLFYLLYFNIFTTTRSALSKLVEPGELGRLFTVLGVLHACMGLFSGPLFGILYKATIDVMPGLWLIVIAGSFWSSKQAIPRPTFEFEPSPSLAHISIVVPSPSRAQLIFWTSSRTEPSPNSNLESFLSRAEPLKLDTKSLSHEPELELLGKKKEK